MALYRAQSACTLQILYFNLQDQPKNDSVVYKQALFYIFRFALAAFISINDV